MVKITTALDVYHKMVSLASMKNVVAIASKSVLKEVM